MKHRTMLQLPQELAHAAREQGNALIVTIVTVAIVSAIAATALLVTTSKFGTAFQAASWQESLQGAEAATDLAMAALNSNTWTGWYNVNGTPTSTQPTGGTVATGEPANGTYNYYIPPTLTHVGEGNSNVKMWVTVDGASETSSLAGCHGIGFAPRAFAICPVAAGFPRRNSMVNCAS